MSSDIVIIGGGFAGLTAANRAAERGLKPLVLEAGSERDYRCNSRITTGALHVASRNPREPADDLFRAVMGCSGGTAREDLARALTARAAAATDWMAAQGAAFADHPRRSDGVRMIAPPRAMRAGLDWENSGPNLFLQRLEAALVRRGGALRRGWRATRIVREGGHIAGVEATGGSDTETIAARVAVIADGGFQADSDLVARHIARASARLMQRNAGTGRGDGLRMATAVGAATTGLETFYGHLLSRDAMTNRALWPYPQVDVIAAKAIVVDGTGRRFADEGLGGIFMANAIARLDDPLSAVAVFDSTVWDDARSTDNVPPNPSLPEAGGTVIEAPDFNELAHRAGIDPAGLSATVIAHNAFVRTGRLEPNAPSRTTAMFPAHPLERPPYFAIPLCAGITVTSGGIAVDGRARVLDAEDRPIPGLYAAGSCVGGLEGGPACGYVGGLIKAFGIGLIAGDSIAVDLARR